MPSSKPKHPSEHQRDLLMEALQKMLVAVGVIRPDATLSGSKLLLAVDTYLESHSPEKTEMTNQPSATKPRSMPHERAVAIAGRVLGSYMGYLQPNDAIIRAVQAGYAEALAQRESPKQLQKPQTEEKLRALLAAAYQIVGVLADRADLFEHPFWIGVQKGPC